MEQILDKINSLIAIQKNNLEICQADYHNFDKKLKEFQIIAKKEFGFELNVNQQGHNLYMKKISEAREKLRVLEELKKCLI